MGEVTGTPRQITVRFRVPVEGIDLSDGEVFLATRHRVAAVCVRQDRNETLFINDDGEVVARWATGLLEHIDWPDDNGASSAAVLKPSVGTLEWRKNVQERHPRAYQRWTPEEDAELIDQFRAGCTVAEMAKLHDRRSGGISARLVRLGLISRDTPNCEIGQRDLSVPAPVDEAPVPAVVTTVGPAVAPADFVPVVEIVDDTCRHDLPLKRCSICRYDDRPSVYIAAGGVRFHARPDCPALIEGQRHVEVQDGTTEPIEVVHRASERLEGRDVCRQCTPS